MLPHRSFFTYSSLNSLMPLCFFPSDNCSAYFYFFDTYLLQFLRAHIIFLLKIQTKPINIFIYVTQSPKKFAHFWPKIPPSVSKTSSQLVYPTFFSSPLCGKLSTTYPIPVLWQTLLRPPPPLTLHICPPHLTANSRNSLQHFFGRMAVFIFSHRHHTIPRL